MTPQEKAKELVDKYRFKLSSYLDREADEIEFAKKCALITVDEILKMKKEFWDDLQDDYFKWWQEVKQEIEKL